MYFIKLDQKFKSLFISLHFLEQYTWQQTARHLFEVRNTKRGKSDPPKKVRVGGGAAGGEKLRNFEKEGAEIPSQCKFWSPKSGKGSQLLRQNQLNERHEKNSPAEDRSEPEYLSEVIRLKKFLCT